MADRHEGQPPAFVPGGGQTIGEACMQASSYLAAHGVGEPRANAERLLQHVLGLERAALLRDWRDPFPAERLPEWAALVARKAAGEPVQYLTGEQWFYGRPFTVTPAVLIPRPETELLVEAVLEAADRLWPAAGAGPVPTVVDVGTGSGAIAVTVAAERPAWRVWASDLSADAIAVARGNAARHGASARIAFAQGDLLGPFLRPAGAPEPAARMNGERGDREPAGADRPAASAQDWPGRQAHAGNAAADAGRAEPLPPSPEGLRIDVLVSNPPYIPAGDIPGLQREVREHEPRLALDGGPDGLEPYRRMAAQLPLLAVPPRLVGFELGMGQAGDVAALLRGLGLWDEVRIIRDYAGIERHVLAVAAAARE